MKKSSRVIEQGFKAFLITLLKENYNEANNPILYNFKNLKGEKEDCDRVALARAMYYEVFGVVSYKRNGGVIYGSDKGETEKRWSFDTINSYRNIRNKVIQLFGEEVECLLLLHSIYHTFGNFVPIPFYVKVPQFKKLQPLNNRRNSLYKDFWDLSLPLIEDAFKQNSQGKDFKEHYIKRFFLQDYYMEPEYESQIYFNEIHSGTKCRFLSETEMTEYEKVETQICIYNMMICVLKRGLRIFDHATKKLNKDEKSLYSVNIEYYMRDVNNRIEEYQQQIEKLNRKRGK